MEALYLQPYVLNVIMQGHKARHIRGCSHMLFLILHLYSKLTDTAHFYERKRARQNAIDMQRAGFEPANSGDVTRKIPFF